MGTTHFHENTCQSMGGILEKHCASFNALQLLFHVSVKILTAGLIHV